MSTEHGHHPAPLSDVEARTRALESILLEKGLLTPDAVDKVIAAYERDIGPLNGARVVARAWVDAAYKKRLLTDDTRPLPNSALAEGRASTWWWSRIRRPSTTSSSVPSVPAIRGRYSDCHLSGTSPHPTARGW